MDRDASRAAARRRSLPVTKAIIGVDSRHFALSEINVGYTAPVQGPLVVRARTAIAGYEVEMVPVVGAPPDCSRVCFHRWTHCSRTHTG